MGLIGKNLMTASIELLMKKHSQVLEFDSNWKTLLSSFMYPYVNRTGIGMGTEFCNVETGMVRNRLLTWCAVSLDYSL